MNKKIIAAGLCALSLMACDQKVEPKSEPTPNVQINDSVTDDQKFSYMLGSQFGGPSFANIAVQLGEYFDVDYLIQGIYDNGKALKDTSFKLQIEQDSMKVIDEYFADVAAKRVKQASPDSATEMSFKGDIRLLRAYVDSAIRTLPIAPAAPIKKQTVTITEAATKMQMYSYVMGTQLHLMFNGVERQFGQDFDIDYFVLGAREACMNALDSTFAPALPKDSLKAVNDRYVVKIKEIMQKKREELNRQLAENAAQREAANAAAGDSAKADAKPADAKAAEPAEKPADAKAAAPAEKPAAPAAVKE